ncbi:MAG: hypothetical protein AAGC55_21170, partial [Myxococcota bacterium]
HTIDNEPGWALGSLGMRLLLPIATGVVGYRIDRARGASGEDPGLVGTILGASAGAMVASAIDVFVLSRDRVEEPADEFAARPSIVVEPEQWTLGVAGSF